MVEPHAVLQVADGVLNLGVAAMVGLEVQRVTVSIGDESVIAVIGEERQLGAGGGPDPADDEPHRRCVGCGLKGVEVTNRTPRSSSRCQLIHPCQIYS